MVRNETILSSNSVVDVEEWQATMELGWGALLVTDRIVAKVTSSDILVGAGLSG